MQKTNVKLYKNRFYFALTAHVVQDGLRFAWKITNSRLTMQK